MRSKSVPVNIFIRKINTFLGEGGEDGSPDEGEKLEGDDDLESMSATSAASQGHRDDDDVCSPPPRELLTPTSPRSFHGDQRNLRSSCTSRDSADSPPPPSPSAESMMSERAALLRGIPLGTSLSPVGVALPPSLPAAAFLPPQSAAMAAYLNAAAAVAQQSHRLMMTSPLPPAYGAAPMMSSTSPMREHSPPGDGVLDFSRRDDSDSDSTTFSKLHAEGGSCPLDLSVGSRKRTSEEPLAYSPQQRKPRTAEFKPTAMPPWPPQMGPYFAAAVAAAGLASPKPNAAAASAELWNGKVKHAPPAPNEATKALEKMSELSKLGGDELFRGLAPSNSATNRHSAWQSHWLNKGAEQAKDVLKCVWCKQSFPSLAALTTHMKEAKHCGVNVPVPPMPHHQNLVPQPQITSPSNTTTTSNSSSSSNKPGGQSDLNMLIKETMPLPRKLVRGQDVWLGKGAEQTRQILKCMWCGQSFRSLAEMTSHMQQTQHYTNIISQEQIISWRSTDDPKGGGGGGGGGSHSGAGPPPGGASSHVSAVLTCKVCDQAFSSLKELSNHMVKNSHYKEHIMRSITESGGRRRQTREKRKKSLPVRKLLELERAQHDFKNGDSGVLEKMREAAGAGRITCEKCGNKIETSQFVDHIRQCVGGMTSNQRNFLKSALMSSSKVLPPESPNREKLKTPNTDKSPSPHQQSPSVGEASATTKEPSETNNGSSPSVLNAIEKLIEKSFDSRSRQNANFPGHGPAQTPMGSSILKRLGIDESVDYTKPLVDAQTMNLLRSYHHQQQQQQQSHHYGRRERSGSESSSMSERGSSRVESLTPERKMEPPGVPASSTPRSTPDIKREKSPASDKLGEDGDGERMVVVKREVEDESKATGEVKVKREMEEPEEDEGRSYHSNGDASKEEGDKTPPTESPGRHSTSSPASSDRSGTPRSTNGDKKSAGGGSLGALSSMFDNLSGTNPTGEPSQSGGGKRGSSHPLAALQKLCDKTETHPNNSGGSGGRSVPSATVVNPGGVGSSAATTAPGAILAFSWACNDAVVTSDSIMKCAFCDTPFISKGAYRHHLSKMHFVKDGVMPDPVTLKSPQAAAAGAAGVPLKSTASASAPGVPGASSGSGGGGKSPPAAGGFEESPHSKFLKYTELAKQLSSKYV